MPVVLYHNPRCSKSRATLKLLEDKGIAPRVVAYLTAPPGAEEYLDLIKRLDGPPMSLVRQGEADFAASGLAVDETDPLTIATALARYPRLLQRPVVVNGEHARIGRPPEAVIEIL